MLVKTIKMCAMALIITANVFSQSKLPVYLDDNQAIEARVEDALSRMTIQEKINMIHAQSKFSSPGVPRLGIPDNWRDHGPARAAPGCALG